MDKPIERTFDWKPVFDKRSKQFPVSAILPREQELKFTLWKNGPIIDQGSEGACVGFGWTAETMAGPIQIKLTDITKEGVPHDPTDFAHYVYKNAQKVDQWPGEDYSGTSVLAGAKVLMGLGILHEYRWAFSVNDIVGALMSHGPVVLGVNWYQGMYRAPDGKLQIFGSKVGGHCLLAIGYNPSSEKFDGKETIFLQNSWGKGWGIDGIAEMTLEDLNRLVNEGGEACVPLARGIRSNPKELLQQEECCGEDCCSQ
jgi:hypothetical protein